MTIWEILIVIAVIGILAVMVLPGFAKIKKIQVLKSATEDIVFVIEKARSQTLASLNSSVYGVHFQSDKIIIFTGTSFSPDATSNEATDIISPATVSSINLYDSSADIYFNRLSGLPSATGSITVSVSGIPSKTVTVSAVGSASVN